MGVWFLGGVEELGNGKVAFPDPLPPDASTWVSGSIVLVFWGCSSWILVKMLSKRVIGNWYRLATLVVGLPSLEVLQKCAVVVLGGMLSGQYW